ncbi:hypothetical protein EDD18DRAFT_1376704, partial [Armillaria luteobubalina]
MATEAAATHFLQLRIQYSSIALLCYDYALTFPTEVKYMWCPKFKLTTALYICCRYALIVNVLYPLAIANKLGARVLPFFCRLWFTLLIRSFSKFYFRRRNDTAVTFTAHTYVICARSKIILSYLVTIGLVCVITDIMHLPGLRCVGSSS